jgi:prolyl-tRNA editing enzyme YbaK/EbsC (Cys-tRNA(Pro) deacylase)
MPTYEQKLKAYIEREIPSAEHMEFEDSCHSVAEAARAANASPDELVKNVCMIGADGALIVAIVRGTDRASTSRVGKALGQGRPRLATPEEILGKTGYPCGGTPSFGYPAVFLVDPRVVETELVITGGGSERALVRVKTQDLVRANQGRVVRVRK